MRKIDLVNYWEQFYSDHSESTPNYPSQFAAFVRNELPNLQYVVEVGCGNGRDANFFALYGAKVLAIDASNEVIQQCKKKLNHPNLIFVQSSVSEASSPIETFFKTHNQPILLYGRFFLHAITLEEETAFFESICSLLNANSFLALEYRLPDDALQTKVFGEHYRRFIDHAKVCKKLIEEKFDILYETQGTGLAKYKNEDARVGRCIAVRR